MPDSEFSSPDFPAANPVPLVEVQEVPPTPGVAAATPIYRLFVGPQGIRAGWRLLLYVALVAALGFVLNGLARIVPPLHALLNGPPSQMRADAVILGETLQSLAVLVPAFIMGWLERRPVGVYGLAAPRRNIHNLSMGFLWGLVLVSVVVGAIAAFHGYSVDGIALSTEGVVEFGLLWLVAFIGVGLFEEFATRGYTQYTLASGIGFWPAAVIMSALFGAGHLSNPGEGLVGAAQVFLIAMFFCLTLRRTGSLWFAVGAHASFDWGETYLYSVPNSGLTATGHLLKSSLHGPAWVTGGTVGPEGSAWCFLFVALSFVVFDRLYPKTPVVGSRSSVVGTDLPATGD